MEYPFNVEVFPKIKDSKIFFFKEESLARYFAALMKQCLRSEYIVVKCVATNPKICTRRISSHSSNVLLVSQYWSNPYMKSVVRDICKGGIDKVVTLMKPPEGTWLADSVTCFDERKYYVGHFHCDKCGVSLQDGEDAWYWDGDKKICNSCSLKDIQGE